MELPSLLEAEKGPKRRLVIFLMGLKFPVKIGVPKWTLVALVVKLSPNMESIPATLRTKVRLPII